jgi:cytochrome c2
MTVNVTTRLALIAAVALSSNIAVAWGGDAPPVRGQEVYRQQGCAMCHSIAGKGNRRAPLDGVGGRLSPDDIRKWLVAPQEMKPGVKKKSYEKLPPADLNALVEYLAELKK